MKKAVVILFLMGLFFTGCSSASTSDWQMICIERCGTIKIPDEWDYYEKDGLVYIVDANTAPIMIQTQSYSRVADGKPGRTESNDFYKDITNIKSLSDVGLSNGATYGQVLLDCNGTEIVSFFLDIGYDRYIKLIVWDETVDEKVIKKIAKTFVAVD